MRCVFGSCAAVVSLAGAQPLERVAYVANNGNLEGSVTTYRFAADGAPIFVEKIVIGSRASADPAIRQTNAYDIAVSPSGRYVVNTHATSFSDFEQITIWSTNPDGTLTMEGSALTPDSPLGIAWITDDLIAVTRTQTTSANNEILTYRFVPPATLTLADRKPAGGFAAYVTAHPNGRVIYVGNSTTGEIRVFGVSATGALTLMQTIPTGAYPLDPAISPDGTLLYAFGGISSGGSVVTGHFIDNDGLLSPVPGSPFISGGSSPKEGEFSPDGSLLYVSHGSDATVRSYFVDPVTGDLSPTGGVFDVGLQGSHGDTGVLRGLVMFTDDTTATDGLTGLYVFGIAADGGFFDQRGPLVPTQGITPEHIATWEPARCRADLSGASDPNDPNYGVPDGSLDAADFFYFLDQFAAGNTLAADLSGSTDPNDPGYGRPDGLLDAADFFFFLDLFVQGC